ncbi:hypothetical protein JK358_37375 [Nocardia sp. 2]|uniref:DUF8176 domain-containing protein n=1 Tax=Nocardia acididurans TaxID=2802282 RepID=A0ABS1MHM5_9NOCA|nr:hypothetical protein [Nocardia acididurans]MBL1080084.1 hypothetical protein [Nocardia acididurans]
MNESWRGWLPDQAGDTEIDDGTTEFEAEFVDDDPMAAIKAGMRERIDAASARRRAARIARIATAAVAGTAAVVLLAGGRNDSPAAAAPTVSEAAAPSPSPWCADSRSGSVVVGSGQGKAPGTPGVSGPELILFQQWQWYVARNADAARSVLSADAHAADADAARAAVAAVPAGTRHCVTITTLGAGRFDVQIEEKHPDGSTAQWQQTVTTAAPAGQLVITAITAGGEL